MNEFVRRRQAELATALARVRERTCQACLAAGRDPMDVQLLAVTKTFPVEDVALLADLGLTNFGENRDGEAVDKVAGLARLRPRMAVRWHMVGRLQRNKARSVARWAAGVQSIDSDRLTDVVGQAARIALDRGDRGVPLDVLVQASIDGDPARGGCPLPELPKLADLVAGCDALRLAGVMAVAPLGMPPEQAFGQLAEAAARLRVDYPEAREVSAGMSGDLEAAIAHGATWVRVGTALLGSRPLA